MLSKATFLISAGPFLALALCGCGGAEVVSDNGAAVEIESPASQGKAGSTEEKKGAKPSLADTKNQAGASSNSEEKTLGGIAAIVGNKVISRPRLRKKVDRQILNVMATQQVVASSINRRAYEKAILKDLVNKELILQAQLAAYPGSAPEDLVTMDNVMAYVDREIQKRRKAGANEVITREDYFDIQKNELGTSRDEMIDEIRERMLSEMYLWQEVYGKLDTFVSPSESRAYYRSHPEEFTTPLEVSYQRIKLFDSVNSFEKIKNVREGLQAGKSFSELAIAYSEEFEKTPRLRANVFKNKYSELDDFPFPIPVILKRLREGQFSGPDRAQGAYWFFQMKEIIKGEPKTYKQAQGDIENKLLIARRRIAYSQLIDKLKISTRVEVYLGGPTASAAAPAQRAPAGPALGPKPPKEPEARP